MCDTDTLTGFECSKPEFKKYLAVLAPYAQKERMGQTYLCRYKETIVGYVVMAASHLDKKNEKKFNIDLNQDIPVVQITYLAVHKDYERQGIGRMMVYWSIEYTKAVSQQIGCRAVLAHSERDVVGFYEKLGFKLTRDRHRDTVSMYFDVGCRE